MVRLRNIDSVVWLDTTTADPVDLIACCSFAFGSSTVLAVLLVYCILCSAPEVKERFEDWSQRFGNNLSPVNARTFFHFISALLSFLRA
jgi:hypothetical protein